MYSEWHNTLETDEVPNDEATVNLMYHSGDYRLIKEAVEICKRKNIQGYSSQYAYILAIIRNKLELAPKKWDGK